MSATKFGPDLQIPGRPSAPPGLDIREPRLGKETQFDESLKQFRNSGDM